MKIYLGSDHGGFALKESFESYLAERHTDANIEDCGALTHEKNDDYPVFAFAVAQKIKSDQDLGILFCRSGSGMVIAANKVKGIRAVEIYNEQIAAHAKSHNHANVIAFSGDYLSLTEITKLFEVFLSTPQDESERHSRRIEIITNYENNH